MGHPWGELPGAVARIAQGDLPLGLIQYRDGTWGFTGSVPVNLMFVRLDGKALTKKEERELANNPPPPTMFARFGIRRVSFETKAEAVKAAKKVGATVQDESKLRKRSYVHEEKVLVVDHILEVSRDEVEVNGKKGVWRRIANLNIFFPSDGSDPVGIPKPKDKHQEKKEVIKAKKKVKFFNKLFRTLKKNGK